MLKKCMELKKNEIHLYLVISYKTYKECLMKYPSLSFFMTDSSAPVTTKGVLEVGHEKIISFFFRKLSMTKWGESLDKLKNALENKEYELAVIHADGSTDHLATFKDEPKYLSLQMSFENRYKFINLKIGVENRCKFKKVG